MPDYNVKPEASPKRTQAGKPTPTKSNEGIGGYGSNVRAEKSPSVSGWSDAARGKCGTKTESMA